MSTTAATPTATAAHGLDALVETGLLPDFVLRLEPGGVFFLACAELFAWSGGEEWLVTHVLFRRPGEALAEGP